MTANGLLVSEIKTPSPGCEEGVKNLPKCASKRLNPGLRTFANGDGRGQHEVAEERVDDS
jgi:hypothetical protein